MHPSAILAVLLAWNPATPPPADDARATAQAVLDKGAKLFDARDAKGLAETYLGDAVFVLESKDQATGLYKAEEHRGRAEIERFYRRLFDGNGGATTSRNTVEYAKQIGPDLMVVTGVFQPDVTTGGGLNFVQIRVKDGDRWLMKELRIYLLPPS